MGEFVLVTPPVSFWGTLARLIAGEIQVTFSLVALDTGRAPADGVVHSASASCVLVRLVT